MADIKRERRGKVSLEVSRELGKWEAKEEKTVVREIRHMWKEALMRHLSGLGEIIGHYPFFSHLCPQSQPHSPPHSGTWNLSWGRQEVPLSPGFQLSHIII